MDYREEHVFNPSLWTVTDDDAPETVHLTISGLRCGWNYRACGGDADPDLWEGLQVHFCGEREIN